MIAIRISRSTNPHIPEGKYLEEYEPDGSGHGPCGHNDFRLVEVHEATFYSSVKAAEEAAKRCMFAGVTLVLTTFREVSVVGTYELH